jgi:hypothetical protein
LLDGSSHRRARLDAPDPLSGLVRVGRLRQSVVPRHRGQLDDPHPLDDAARAELDDRRAR